MLPSLSRVRIAVAPFGRSQWLLCTLLVHAIVGFSAFVPRALGMQTAIPTQDTIAEESEPSSVPETEAEAKERVLAERFLQVLRRAPRLGTALDKVYGFHVGRGSLDQFCTSLQKEAQETGDGKTWMILGMVQMQRGQDAAAAGSLEQAEQLLPNEPLASYYLGKTQLLLGEIDQAAVALRRATQKKPARADMLQIFKELGRIYQRTGRNQEALQVWEDLEALFPNDTGVKEQIAAILAQEGAEEAALERYSRLAEQTQDRFRKVEMSIRAAQLKAKLGRTDEALRDFEAQLSQVNPTSWLHRDIRSRIEEVFWTSSDFDGLVSYYTKWSEEHPDDVDAMMRTARVLSIQKRTPEANAWFRKAIERAPSNVDARSSLVEALASDDNFAEASLEMQQLVALEPDNPDYLVRWGELVLQDQEKAKADRQNEAEAIWKRMLESRGDDAVTVARVADLLRGAELSDATIEMYRKAISLADSEPQYREYLGEYLHQLQRKNEALAVWEELAAGDRRNRDSLVRLSEVFSTFDYDEKALEKMAEACELKPQFGHRARYAELLRESGDFEAALAQLDLAEPLADDRELREVLIDERIKNYQGNGKLKERIADLETQLEGERAEDAATWRLLALFREADRAFQNACNAIEKATSLAPEDVVVWESAASLYERTGRFGEAVSAYRKLATIDRRFLSNYLTQIATLEMRLGNTAAALKAGEDLLASAPGNSDNYRFFASLCMQTGDAERGLEALRRNVRSNPNDQDALSFLAKTLADEFQTDEAIELYWRSFELAKDVDSKIPNIEALTELYLRTNRFPLLIERLEIVSREENKTREGTLWIAAAHQAAGDLGMARQLLEQLVREDSRDTKLLEQLVDLSKVEYDFESAADYQKRLLAISPSDQGQYVLASLLMELGELDQAEALWMKLASSRSSAAGGLASSISDLINKEQFATAASLADKALQKDPDNWELQGHAMTAYYKDYQVPKAAALAESVLASETDPTKPTAKVREAIERLAAQKSGPSRSTAYSSLGAPSRLASTMSQIKRALMTGSDDPFAYSPNYRPYTPQCFGDVRAIALGIQLSDMKDAEARAAFVQKTVDAALASDKPEDLWLAYAYCVWEQASAVARNGDESSSLEKCLARLVSLDDPAAASMLLTQKYSPRSRAMAQGESMEPLSKDELDELIRLEKLTTMEQTVPSSASYLKFWIIDELRRADDPRGEAILKEAISEKAEPFQLLQSAAMMLQPMMLRVVDEEQASQALATAMPIINQAIRQTNSKTQNATYITNGLTSIIPAACKYGDIDQAIELLENVLELQARLTADMRPSQRDATPANARNFYQIQLGGNYEQIQVTFPTPTGYFSSETINALNSLVEGAKRADKMAEVQAAAARWGQTDTDDPYLQFAHLMAKACVEYWTDQPQAALASISEANQLSFGTQIISLMQARMQYDNGDVRGALKTVESLRPSNQKMLVDRELTLLTLVLQLGDLERAKLSAQKLFALRLDSATEFKLADLMYQLGMKDMGDRMMSRIQRRAGGKQDTLTQLMSRYASAGELDKAAEIARQVVRRTKPAVGSRRTSDNVQNQQALQILVQAKQIDDLISRYERLVERSPKSLPLINQLAAMYEASGRRSDATLLRSKAAESLPANPQNMLAVAQQLAQAGKKDAAIEKYVEAIRLNPELLNNSYYEMRSVFTEKKAWPKMADMMIKEGLTKFTRSYRTSEIFSELVREKQSEPALSLLEAYVDAGDWNQMSQALSRLGSRLRDTGLEISESLAKKIVKRLADPSITPNSVSYVSSMQNDGRSTGVINYLTEVVSRNESQLAELKSKLTELVEAEPNKVFQRVVLCMLHIESGDLDQARELVEPLLEKELRSSNNQTAQALWVLASSFVDKERSPQTTIKILESFEKLDAIQFGYSGLGFESSPENLLCTAYENAGESDKAKQGLIQVLESMEVDTRQNQYNPGYGEYQYINSMDGLARRLLASDAPVEALIAHQKAYGNPEMLAASQRWGGGNASSRGSSLQAAIQKAMTPEIVNSLVQSVLIGDGDSMTYQYLTSPKETGTLMSDTRLALPLEEFLGKLTAEQKKLLRDELKSELQSDEPEPPTEEHPDLQTRVSQLVVATAIGDRTTKHNAIESINAWLASHPQPEPLTPPENANPDASANIKVDVNANADSWNQELLLAIAARQLQKDSPSPEKNPDDKAANAADAADAADPRLATTLIERAISAATHLQRENLAFGLRLQLASNVALRDKVQARELYMQALDQLLPNDED